MSLTALELETYLMDFSIDDSYMIRTKLPTYLALMDLMSQATQFARGFGYHKSVGWFVLESGPAGPYILWTERGSQ